MNIHEEYEKALAAGVPNAFIAKHIGYDPSTVHKWASGVTKGSPQLEAAIAQELLKLKEQWMNIMNEDC